ncbi:MAG TPA: transporter [Candidatus Angelobacter sp.]|nr:transporter [Candidatus Angelobacter sp.]
MLATTSVCWGQVHLPDVNLGDTNFEDGFGSPGWFLQEFPEGYVAGDFKDVHGNTIPGRNRAVAYSTSSFVGYMSEKRIFGGWVAWEALEPIADLEIQVANHADARVSGFADTTVGAGLQWAPKKISKGEFGQRVVLDVTVPTGKYSDRRPVNIGNHFVMVEPYYAVTYELKKIEFSARFHYFWNSTNNDPFIGFGIRNLQPGQATHLNYATSYELWKNIRLGFNGYWLQQVTDHKINDAGIPHSKERTIGLGPGIQISNRDTWFRLNGYIETDVRNRPSGIKVTFRISKAIPTKEP